MYYILLHFTTFLEVLVARFPYSHIPMFQRHSLDTIGFMGLLWSFDKCHGCHAEVALLAIVALAQNHLSAVSEEWPCSGAHQCPGPFFLGTLKVPQKSRGNRS
jgi:hypothetical protein